MPALTVSTAANLDPTRAADLARVLDLQARWECLLADGAGGTSVVDLRARQAAYDAYRARRAEYERLAGAGAVPETTANTPDRVAGWCRVVAAVARRAGVGCPAVVEKAYRLADRVAARLKVEPVARAAGADAARVLDEVAAWCDGLMAVVPGRGWNPTTGRTTAA